MYDVGFRKLNGFTLIELLVVIAIIAVLVAFAVANFVGARSRARDLKKKSEFQEMKNALRLYYNDYQTYPETGSATNTFNGCGALTPPTDSCSDAFSNSTSVYMKLLPPTTEYVWHYQQMPLNYDFCMWTSLENKSDAEIAKSQTRCSICSGVGYTAETDYVICAD